MTIMDQALSKPCPSYLKPDIHRRLLYLRNQASRFVFSANASSIAGKFALDAGDLVLKHRQFAIPPFEKTYIEIDARRWYESTNRVTGPPNTQDTRVGYLIDGYDVFVFADGPDSMGPMPAVLGYRVVPPSYEGGAGHDVPFILGGEGGEWSRLVGALGTTLERLNSEEERLAISQEIAFRLYTVKQPSAERYMRMLRATAGEVRNLWTCLLWLNQPTRIQYVNEPAGARLIKGKRVAYRAQKVIEIDVGRIKTIRRLMRFEDRESPVRHKVRGAFHHTGGSQHCSHEWTLFPDEHGHWYCDKCARMRWWVKDHVRGDSTKGWNDSQYSVEASQPPTY